MNLITKKCFQVLFMVAVLGFMASTSLAAIMVTQQLTDNDSNDINPQVSGKYAVWEWKDPNEGDWEIMFYDSKNIIQLTNNSTDDINPQLSGKRVVWEGVDPNDGDWEIFYSNGLYIQQLTNDQYDDLNPKISKSLIIWESWDGNDWEIETALAPVSAGIKFTPQSLNLKSKGGWVSVHLKVPEGMSGSQVDKSSLKLMGQVSVSKVQKGDGSRKLTLKFKRSDVQALLTPGPEVVVFLTGQFKDGTPIEASDTIKVIDPGK